MDTTLCNSPEFEFWKLPNPSFPQPTLLSADELFLDGVLRPLNLLSTAAKPGPQPPTSKNPVQHSEPGSGPASSPIITESSSSSASSSATSSESKRWKDIFRKTEKNNSTEAKDKDKDKDKEKEKDKEKGKKKERRSGASVAELNINIWPFSRSRSAGNSITRPKFFAGAPATRKVNSAPCSRSNSTGESKYRKLPSSPGRAGVHVGRSSPVWQVRRGTASAAAKNSEPQAEKGSKVRDSAASRWSKVSGSGKARVLNLNVPMCIGYRHNLSCRSNENGGVGVSSATATATATNGSDSGDDRNGGNIFNLRSLFTKKSIVTSH